MTARKLGLAFSRRTRTTAKVPLKGICRGSKHERPRTAPCCDPQSTPGVERQVTHRDAAPNRLDGREIAHVDRPTDRLHSGEIVHADGSLHGLHVREVQHVYGVGNRITSILNSLRAGSLLADCAATMVNEVARTTKGTKAIRMFGSFTLDYGAQAGSSAGSRPLICPLICFRP